MIFAFMGAAVLVVLSVALWLGAREDVKRVRSMLDESDRLHRERQRELDLRQSIVRDRETAVSRREKMLGPAEALDAQVQALRNRIDELRHGARDLTALQALGITRAAKSLLLDSRVQDGRQYAPAPRWEALAHQLAELGLWPPTLPDVKVGEEQMR